MKIQNIQRVAVLLALSVLTFTASCYAESKEDYVFYAIPANGKVITIPFISLGEAKNDEPIYGTGKHKQFRYCRLSGKDIETFQCSESRRGKPSVIYRRMPKYPEDEALSLFNRKIKLTLTETGGEIRGYSVCESGCGKEVPQFVFQVIYQYNLLSGDSAIGYIGEYDEYVEKAFKAHKKGQWLALQRIKNGWRLVPVKPKFEPPPPDSCTTVGIITVNISDADILLSDSSLTPGVVESSWAWEKNLPPEQPVKNPGLPNIGEERKLYLNKHQYSLKNKDGHIFLSFQGKSQYLFDYSGTDNTGGGATIAWIGDLDRDGKMDIIFDISDDYALRESRLYLSGKAAAGLLVKLVAKMRNGGSC